MLAILVTLAVSGLLPGTQEVHRVAPKGWSSEANTLGWTMKPGDLKDKQFFTATFSKREKTGSNLNDVYEAIWKSINSEASVKRGDKVLEDDLLDWRFRRGNGVVTNGQQQSVGMEITALKKGEECFAMILVTDSVDTFTKYSPDANRALIGMLGGSPSGVTPSGASFDATFPEGWKREDRPPMRAARLYRPPKANEDRILLMLPPEPINGNLSQTFEGIWTREMTHGGIKLVNPGLLSPDRPQPLRRRLKNGLAIWYEGGEGRFENRECYTQLYMVPSPSSVTPILVIYGMGQEWTTEANRAPVMKFLESLKPTAPIPKTELFSSNDCVGKWKLTLIAALAGYYGTTGAYLGDASSGGIEHLALNGDGTYTESFAGKSPTAAWTHQEKGSWKLEDATLTLSPQHASDKAPLSPQRFRVYGRAMLGGTECLLLGSADGSRIPTDALESGAMLEMSTRGGSLFRYEAEGG